ncbi:MAG: aminopeptidase P family N-terminal domain-containing protein, partial [Desulfobaccales bacterium]
MPDTSESLRLPALRDLLSSRDFDAIMISGPENRRYLSGFSAEDPDWGVLLITQAAALLITDFRYQIWARQEAPAFRVEVYRQDLGQSLAQFFKELGVR